MHHPTDRIAHTTAFVTPVVEHWLEREIAQWVHPVKYRSDDPSHNERTLLPRSYISLPLELMHKVVIEHIHARALTHACGQTKTFTNTKLFSHTYGHTKNPFEHKQTDTYGHIKTHINTNISTRTRTWTHTQEGR